VIMLTSGKQIAAARQLLDWSQAELANRAGVSKPSIIRIEKDLMSVKDDIRQAVIESFSQQKVEFIDGGTRINEKIVEIIEGEDCYLKLLDDAMLTLLSMETPGEFIKSGANEKRSSEGVIRTLNDMRIKGISFRSLLKNNDTFMRGPEEEYRWMPDELYTDSDVKVIYGDKVAYLVSWFNTYRVIIIKDKKIAEEHTRLFNYIWKISNKAKKES